MKPTKKKDDRNDQEPRDRWIVPPDFEPLHGSGDLDTLTGSSDEAKSAARGLIDDFVKSAGQAGLATLRIYAKVETDGGIGLRMASISTSQFTGDSSKAVKGKVDTQPSHEVEGEKSAPLGGKKAEDKGGDKKKGPTAEASSGLNASFDASVFTADVQQFEVNPAGAYTGSTHRLQLGHADATAFVGATSGIGSAKVGIDVAVGAEAIHTEDSEVLASPPILELGDSRIELDVTAQGDVGGAGAEAKADYSSDSGRSSITVKGSAHAGLFGGGFALRGAVDAPEPEPVQAVPNPKAVIGALVAVWTAARTASNLAFSTIVSLLSSGHRPRPAPVAQIPFRAPRLKRGGSTKPKKPDPGTPWGEPPPFNPGSTGDDPGFEPGRIGALIGGPPPPPATGGVSMSTNIAESSFIPAEGDQILALEEKRCSILDPLEQKGGSHHES